MAFQPDPERGAMDTARDDDAGAPYLQQLKHVFLNRIWLACTASYVAYTFAMGGLSTWGPTLLQRRFAVSTAQAGLVFGGLAVVTGVLGTFLGGWLTDRWQKRWPDAGIGISGLTLLAAAPLVALALGTRSLNVTYLMFFLAMFLLFINTSPVNALTVSSLPASVRATGIALNVLLIHLFGDAISPELVGRRADALHAVGLSGGDALARALVLVLPAILLSGLALWWARHRPAPA
jgi:sugar phosphate permease